MAENTPRTMRVLLVEPGKHPKPLVIEHTLEQLQKLVGGYIQAIYPWDDPCALVCDDEGLLKGYPLNRQIGPETIIAGTFFICGLGEEDFADLPDELMEKYSKLLWRPMMFFRTVERGRPTIRSVYLEELEEEEEDDDP